MIKYFYKIVKKFIKLIFNYYNIDLYKIFKYKNTAIIPYKSL